MIQSSQNEYDFSVTWWENFMYFCTLKYSYPVGWDAHHFNLVLNILETTIYRARQVRFDFL